MRVVIKLEEENKMTNELKVIHEQEVLGQVFKIYGSKEEPFFLAKDVAIMIDYSKVEMVHII